MSDKVMTPVRLGARDIIGLGLLGVRTRALRAVLSALGISIGIATLVLVTSIPASSQAALVERLTALGSNQLRVDPLPQNDRPNTFPEKSAAMVERIGPVTSAAQVGNTHTTVIRSDRADHNRTSGIAVLASGTNLLTTINGSLYEGQFLTELSSNSTVVVLGSVAATRLGVNHVGKGAQATRVYIDGTYFTVIGILNPLPLSPDIERAVLVGWNAAAQHLGFDRHPTVVYATVGNDDVNSVRSVLAATISPKISGLAQVSRPSDALAAKFAANETFSGLFIGLAGVALLVGGVGVANTMLISVLERRREIGLRRALGATRRHIAGQFFTEALVLSGLGGVAGVLLGSLATFAYIVWQGWPPVIPLTTIGAGLAGALAVGAIAGIHPSLRATRVTPTESLTAT